MEIIYGKNAVHAYLKSGNGGNHLYLFSKGKFDEIEKLARAAQIQISRVDKHTLDKMVKEGHQGVVLKGKDFEYTPIETIVKNAQSKLIVVCDQIEDPHNLGAILRSVDASGADGVVIGKHRSTGVTSTVSKVSTGAVHAVPVAQVTNIAQTLDYLKKQGYWVVAAENGVDAVSYTDFNADMPIALVMGSEGKGISKLVKEKSDILVTIPMQGSVNSLNVSVATAILLFDIVRRRKG